MAGLREGVVIDVPRWKIPVIIRRRIINNPEFAVSIKFTTDDVREMPDQQFKVFEKTFESLFTAAFKKMSKNLFDQTQHEIDNFENEMDRRYPIDPVTGRLKSNISERAKEVATNMIDHANTALERIGRDWQEDVGRIAKKAYDKAYEASLRAMESKITKAKAKIVVKVALVVLLTLTAAALSIFLGVATIPAGTAIAAVVLTAIKTGSDAIGKSIGEIIKNYDAMGKVITAIEKDTLKIKEANEAILRASKKTAGNFDKVKAFISYMSSDVESLNKHVGELDKFVAIGRDKTIKLIKQLHELADKLADAKKDSREAAKLEKQVLDTQRSIDDTLEALNHIDDVKRAAAEVVAASKKYDAQGTYKVMPKLRLILNVLKSASAAAKKVSGPIAEIATGVKTLVTAAT